MAVNHYENFPVASVLLPARRAARVDPAATLRAE
jgi:ABC-type lipoprotein release transport system permease subunit